MPVNIDSYVATRLSMLRGRLIAVSEWGNIIDSDLADLQKRFDCFSEAADVHVIEKKLVDHTLQDFQLLFRPFSGIRREILDYAIHWYELSNLKVLIRGKLSGEKEASIRNQLIDVGHFAALPLDSLLQTEDPGEMLRQLEQTPYAAIVKQARSIYQEEGQNLFALDAAIDRLFFAGLLQRIRFLDEHDRHEFLQVYGSLMDRLNLLWLVRYRFSYGMSPAKAYFLLATSGRRLHATNLMQLARLETVTEVIDNLPEPLKTLLKQADSLTGIENLMEHYSIHVAMHSLSNSSSLITRVFAYVMLRQSQVNWLQAVIKGKLLGFDTQLIKKAVGDIRR